ncbi:replicative DNA helicase [Paralimibaculum aggregatum]|uniref:Replicative DNA helicase n=1 Tax=Paralimibaculum aggregatum TaxID=3036245 RepID=A0ABQ6LFM6_9RHOB|nr:replicative DNA helicase [Limibaculum sp. NKW23]GMG81206.1 replicative DNA helicase [Limibaculum sp. NKW23]
MADGSPAPERAAAPHSIEAEQAVLGALLINNEVFDRISGIIEAHHFYDPVHGRIFALAASRIGKRMLASPVTLKPFLADDEGLKELGGVAYLARLAEAVVSIISVRDYAIEVRDLALRRDLMRIGDEIQGRAATFDAEMGPSEQISEAEQALYTLAERGKYEGGFVTFAHAVEEAAAMAEAAHKRVGGLAGISTGLQELDDKLWGLRNSDLLILAARPSMGKTSLAMNLAFNVARKHRRIAGPDGNEVLDAGGKVGFFSLEMSSEQLANRILISEAQLSAKALAQGNLSQEEFLRYLSVARELEEIPLFIDDTPALPISTLAARARRLKRTHGLDVMIVDYLQLVRGSSSRASENRVQEVSEITQGLKAIAKELDIPVIALSQLSRQVESREDKRPQLSDLRESGSIEQDADVVMFIFREEYYKEREKPTEPNEAMPEEMRRAAQEKLERWMDEMNALKGKAEVIIGKQRHGPICTVELHFEGRFTKFTDPVRTGSGYVPDPAAFT